MKFTYPTQFLLVGLIILSILDTNGQTSQTGSQLLIRQQKLMPNTQLWYKDESSELISKITASKLKFNTIDSKNDTTFIRILDITAEPDTITQNVTYVNKRDNGKLYHLDGGPKKAYKYKYSAWSSGALTVPFKIRLPQDSLPTLISGDAAVLGSYAGIQWGIRSYSSQRLQSTSRTLAIFISPSTINLNDTNSGEEDGKSSTAFGVSMGGALLFALEDFQIGLVAGTDFIGGN